MHLQIKSVVVAGGSGAGARNAQEGAEGVTIAAPGRLVRLLELVEDYNLVRASGSGIETGGEFSFSVETTEENDYQDHQAVLDRILPEFPRSRIVELQEADVPHDRGALRAYLTGFAEQNLLIDEISIGVPSSSSGTTQQAVTIPVQVSVIQPVDYTPRGTR